jgi:beta-carotene 3-hydroxylase
VTSVEFVLIVAAGFVVMEPLTAATHRWVMHGVAEWFHRSHHRAIRTPGWERNDWFPVVFASIVIFGFVLGFNTSLTALVPLGIGVTLYGAAYALVHDGYIHRRLGVVGSRRFAALDRLADAHRIHHLYNAAPYGMLLPVVPAELRARAAATDRDPFAEVTRPVSASAA